jgi:hypothetical protein
MSEVAQECSRTKKIRAEEAKPTQSKMDRNITHKMTAKKK